MYRNIEESITAELVPLLRAALTEGAEVRAALQVLADRVDTLSIGIARNACGIPSADSGGGSPSVDDPDVRVVERRILEQLGCLSTECNATGF